MAISVEKLDAELLLAAGPESKADLLNRYAFENRNGNPKLSVELSEKALKIADSSDYPKGKADALLNIGFAKIHSAEHEESYVRLFEALGIFTRLGDEEGIANSQYNIGLLHIRSGNFDDAIDMLHKCLAYREKSGDLGGAASCYFQMTYIHQHFNDYEAAYDSGLKALNIRRETGDKIGEGAVLMVMGELQLKKGDLVKAKEILGQSMELRKQAGEKMGYFATLLRWSELHMLLHDIPAARKFSEEGLNIAGQEGVTYGVIRFRQMLGKIELSAGNMAASKEHHRHALELGEKYNFKSMLYEIHQSLAELFEKEQNYEKAYYHISQFNRFKEEVITLQSNGRLKSVQLVSKMEFAQKEAEAERARSADLQKAYSIIEEKNKEIIDSITYAKRIQQSLLPPDKYIEKTLARLMKK
jgi:tetratricopeptide (TPR) repeat protein